MRLINRSKQSPLGRQACDAALAKHVELYGDYGRQKMKRTYTVVVQGTKSLLRSLIGIAATWPRP